MGGAYVRANERGGGGDLLYHTGLVGQREGKRTIPRPVPAPASNRGTFDQVDVRDVT